MSRAIRDVHNRQSALRRYRAERLLRKEFAQMRSKVLAIVRSRLRAKGLTLDRTDLEACYSQAWHGLYAAVLAGETVESPEAWLVLVTFRRAVDELRSASRADLGAADDVAALDGEIGRTRASAGGGTIAVGDAASEPDMAAALDDRARLRSLFEAIRLRLSERECVAVSLCYLQGLSRAQAAARMDISERRMQKLMEGSGASMGVAGKFGELLATIQAGEWCEQQSSLMRAYAFGILAPDGERHALAVAHTRECPACRAHVAALRGLASVLPPLPFALAFVGRAGARSASGRGSRAAVRVARGRATLAARTAARLRASLSAGASLPLKLAVTGALLIGAGSAYLAARPSPSPAHARVLSTTAPATSVARGALVSHRGERTHVAARRQAAKRGGAAAKHGGSTPRTTFRGEPSAHEFSPERARGEASSAAPTAPSSRSGEFGIE